jgi:toluene monooxygenase system protein E
VTRRRTYWHLEGQGRKPSEYEIATSLLLYHPSKGFAVRTPVGDWHRRHVDGGALRCRDWDRFRDPRETTYGGYVDRMQRREIVVDGLLETAAATDAALDPDWMRLLERVLPVLRYPVHALQMVAAYAGSLAPSGRLVVTWLFQAADELRRVQRLAYRMRQLQDTWVGFGAAARTAWEEDALWQPWRRVVEQLLGVRDFGETLAALNRVVKPAFDELFFVRFAERARRAGDDVDHRLLAQLGADGVWHAEWTAALGAMLADDDRKNQDVLAELDARWRPAVAEAVAAWQPLLGESHA